MARLSKADKAARDSRLAVQAIVLEKYGQKAIREAMQRLCMACYRHQSCNLYPLTTMGEDCPYFKQGGNVN